MLAQDICTRHVIRVRRDTTVVEAAHLMRHNHVGTLIVVDKDAEIQSPIGIITDRDIVVSAVAQDDQPLIGMRVERIMSSEPIVAAQTDSAAEILRRMRAHGIRRMPVVDERGALYGVVTMDDLIGVIAGFLEDMSALIAVQPEDELEAKP